MGRRVVVRRSQPHARRRKPAMRRPYPKGAASPVAAPRVAEQPATAPRPLDLSSYVPDQAGPLTNPQTDLPRIARNSLLTAIIDETIRRIPTTHRLYCHDARRLAGLRPELTPGGVHLVVTSPPYWTLKEYRRTEGQLGFVSNYDEFLNALDEVWRYCLRLLVPGGRLVCVVGDVCLSRRRNEGRHMVVPLHASIQERCRRLGFDNLAPIIWHKIANAVYEVEN